MTPKSLQRALLGDIRAKTTNLAGRINPGGKLTAQKALQVYQRGYVARLNGALADNFEALWCVLGDKKFFRLCDSYRAAHPSKSHNLNHYGSTIPQFVKKQFPRTRYLFHLARFEALVLEVFNAPELTPAQIDFGGIDPERHVFQFQPSIRLFESPYRIYDLWRHRTRLAKGYSPKRFGSREFVLLYKRHHMHHFAVLTAAQYRIVQALLEGKTIAAALKHPRPAETITEKEVTKLFSLIAEKHFHAALPRSAGA